MTKQEYADYEASVKDFYTREGVKHVSCGTLNCPECDVRFKEGTCPKCQKDSTDFETEPFFSWNRCECCQRPLGGNREDVIGIHEESGEIVEFTFCEDCVYYNEYGHLDDRTMAEIERSSE